MSDRENDFTFEELSILGNKQWHRGFECGYGRFIYDKGLLFSELLPSLWTRLETKKGNVGDETTLHNFYGKSSS